MPTGSSWEIKTAVSVEVSLGPDRAEPSCRAKASAGLAEILILPVYTGVMDQPDQGDTEKQQIPSLWCLLIVGIKSKKKNFPPFALAVVTAAVCHLQSSQCPLGSTRPSAFTLLGRRIRAALPTVLQAATSDLDSCSFAHSRH